MASSRFALAVCLSLLASSALAQDAAQGFALERLPPAPAGSGWLVLDDLSLEGGLGGAVSVTTAYARRPLSLSDGAQRLDLVSDQAFEQLDAAVSYGRFRASASFASPLWFSGQSGVFQGQRYAAPRVSLEQNPDTISDVRFGLDGRLLGDAHGPARLGLALSVFVPSGTRGAWTTDGTVRGLLQVRGAGDVGPFSWAGQLGLHLRPLDEGSVPGHPQGSELSWAVGASVRRELNEVLSLSVGPELFGQTALRAAFARGATGLEALLGARLEGRASDAVWWRIKLAAGGGLITAFGTPDWRAVLGLELLGHADAAKLP